MTRARRGCLLRKSIAVAEFHDLVETIFPGFPVHLETVRIPAVVPPQARERALRKRFLSAFPRNHSRMHGYLKWFSANWASSRFFFDWRYEAQLLIPHNVEMALYSGKEVPKHPFGLYLLKPEESTHDFIRRHPEAARLLSEIDLAHPTIKCVDVYARRMVTNGDIGSTGTIVECGVTDLSDLLLPLAAQIVHQVVWIPYPHNCDLHQEWTDFDTSCDALVIRPIPPSRAETRRIARRFLGSSTSSKRTPPSGTLAG